MKKYLLKYMDREGKIYYSVSCGDYNASWALTINKKDAQRFYGKNAIKSIKTRIKADQKYNSSIKNWGYVPSIEEIEEDPHWYFELDYAIEQFSKKNKDIVKKAFLKTLSGEDKQKIDKMIGNRKNWEKPELIRVHDLWEIGLECLENYYKWCKEN